MQSPKTLNPLAQLEAIAAAEASRRAAKREANRARFPEFAAMTDSGKWKLLHASDAQGEIGKVPPLPPGTVEIDILRGSILEDWAVMTAKRTKR
jgi:hypothetical protein